MPGLKLTFACGLYDRMLSLYTREVRPEGIDLDFIAIHSPREIFDRMAGADRRQGRGLPLRPSGESQDF